MLRALKRRVRQAIGEILAFRDRARASRGRRRSEANALELRQELAAHALELRSHPTSMILEPATACNLRCPFCPTGGGYPGLTKEILQPETFQKIVSNVRVDLLETVVLYNWGEPFVNKHILDYIRYFSSRHVRTLISSNLSAADYSREWLRSLVESGLSQLTVSIDGATQETYEKYRVRGDLARVLGNMKRLDEVKRELGVEYPFVIFRMLLTRHNQDEVEQARALAAEVGATFELSHHFWSPEEHREDWQADSLRSVGSEPLTEVYPRETEEEIDTFCRHLWDSIVVNANGDVFPCCLIYKKEHALGNLAEQHISEIRNNAEMKYLRQFAVDPEMAAPGFENHCESCTTRFCVTRMRRKPPQVATDAPVYA
jgi:radical SAM protein with 4Fe4S-binding SPASM domain